MPYHLDETSFAAFPDDAIVAAALAAGGVPLKTLQVALRTFVCPAPQVAGFGYQQSIAKHLQAHLGDALAVPPLRRASPRVSPSLGEEADLVLASGTDRPAIYVEIEFRPNVEKDLIKFQIAYNHKRLAAAILVVAITKRRVNEAYTSMPEFAKVSRLVVELAPPYPVLLVGIGGEHRHLDFSSVRKA